MKYQRYKRQLLMATSELNRVIIVFKSYGIELEQMSVGPYLNPVTSS